MLTASFDTDRSSSAVIHGAVQYDTGQRLKLCGLPAPWEMGREDELLSGSGVTVQVQFARDGDAQSESLLALWDGNLGAWVAGMPDEYLRRIDEKAEDAESVEIADGVTAEVIKSTTLMRKDAQGCITLIGRWRVAED